MGAWCHVRDASVQRRLNLIVALSVGIAVLVASGLLFLVNGEGALLLVPALTLAALPAAWLTIRRLKRSVSEPVLHLARITSRVSHEGDYSVRAQRQGSDEIGALTDSLNEILTRLEERDRLIESSRETLEEEVAARTAELTALNHQLAAAKEAAEVTVRLKSEFNVATGARLRATVTDGNPCADSAKCEKPAFEQRPAESTEAAMHAGLLRCSSYLFDQPQASFLD